MKIVVLGSMQHAEKMVALRDQLNLAGHEACVTSFHTAFHGKSDEEKERIKLEQKYHQDAIREGWELIRDAEAILVANYDKQGIANYIGGNVLMEIGFAHVLHKKIFLLHPIPDISFYKTEIEAVKPVILHENLSLLS